MEDFACIFLYIDSFTNTFIHSYSHQSRFLMRLLSLFIGLAGIVLLSFFLLGDDFTTTFTHEGSVAWLNKFGATAWIAGILLLAADLVLPVPATLVMSALGYLYGPIAGGLMLLISLERLFHLLFGSGTEKGVEAAWSGSSSE